MVQVTSKSLFSQQIEWFVITAVLYILVVILVGIPTLGLGVFFGFKRLSRKVIVTLYILAAIWGFILPLWVIPAIHFNDWIEVFSYLWLLTIPFFPAVPVLLQVVNTIMRFFKPMKIIEQIEKQQLSRKKSVLAPNSSGFFGGQAGKTTDYDSLLCIGKCHGGDPFPAKHYVKIANGRVYIDPKLLLQHLFIFGASGAGKTETLLRIIYEIFSKTDLDVYFIDGKGEVSLSETVRSLAAYFGRGVAPIFKYGLPEGGALYNGFKGTAKALDNRFRSLLRLNEASGNAIHFAEINQLLAQYIIGEGGLVTVDPPRSFEDLRKRLSLSWLKQTYGDRDPVVNDLAELNKQEFQGFRNRVYRLANEFWRFIDPSGFALEDVRCACFCIETPSTKVSAQDFLNFFIEDLKNAMSQRLTRPAVIIIDEFGQFGNENISSILELGRSKEVAVILASQYPETLGDAETRKRLMQGTRTHLLFRSSMSEEVAAFAGTVRTLGTTVQTVDNERSGVESHKEHEGYKINLNEVGGLTEGLGHLICDRHQVKIQVEMIPKVQSVEPQKDETKKAFKATLGETPSDKEAAKSPLTLEAAQDAATNSGE